VPIPLMPLPYDPGALAPAISRETLEVHHGKHHKGYVDKVNKAVAGTPLADEALEAVIAAARSRGDRKLFNNAGQAWNHGFYWASLSPRPGEPSDDLAESIRRDFGSREALTEALVRQGAGHFASGWIWLAEREGKLALVETHDAETLADGKARPLLVLDLWEHAYYLDRQNDRKAYIQAAVAERLNWAFASERYAARERWTYPAEAEAESAFS
jgi:superoxide dismutase, Fe-Mn family